MRLATSSQSKLLDEKAEKVYGLSSEVVMEVAGALAALEIQQSFFPELSRGRVAFVAGPGHNGGDAMVVARHLHGAGFRDLIVLDLGITRNQSSLVQTQRDRAKSFGIPYVESPSLVEGKAQLDKCTLIVDGLFGVGLARAVQSPYAEWVEAMNASRAPKVALDVPSGLSADTGEVSGVAVKAVSTLTFGLPKPGFFTGSGPAYTGRLRVLPLGYPQALVREVATTHFAFTEKLARRYLPKPSDRSNKSTHGFLQVFAGRSGMWGAAVLSSLAAFRMGAGYVHLSSLEDPQEIVATHPEIMTSKIDPQSNFIHPKATALAVGPGLGVGPEVQAVLEKVKRESRLPVLLDADALNFVKSLGSLPSHWVLTPHAGEMGRMLGVDALEIEKNRIHYVRQAAKIFGCVVLLKGFRTLIAFEDRVMVVLSGNSTLAKAGTGDVLTGMIGSLLAQGLPSLQATATAAYLHGRMADDWIRLGQDKLSMTAGDLTEILPSLLSRLRGESWAPL